MVRSGSARTRRSKAGTAKLARRGFTTDRTKFTAWSSRGMCCDSSGRDGPKLRGAPDPRHVVETIPVRPDEQFDARHVAEFLRASGLDVADLEVEQFPAGQSNLTYLLRSGDWEGVLRRPPLGPVAPR